MTRWTRWVHAIAARFYRVTTMERLVDPILTDVELEYRDAYQSGRVWRARGVLIRGYAGLCAALALHAVHACTSALRPDESARRTMKFSAGAFIVVTVALNLPPLIAASSFQWPHLALYSIPQAIPLGIPIALSFGVLCGWSRETTGRAMLRRVLVLGIGGALTALATAEWLLPAASQQFRATVNSRLAEAGRPVPLTLTRGINDRSLSELASLVEFSQTRTLASDSEQALAGIRELLPPRSRLTAAEQLRHVQMRLHQRVALCLAAAALSLLAVAVATAIRGRNFARAVFAALFLLYVIGWYSAEMAAHALSPVVSGWLPNAAVVMASGVLFLIGLGRGEEHAPRASSSSQPSR